MYLSIQIYPLSVMQITKTKNKMKKLLLMTFSIMCSTFSKSIRPMIFLYRFSGLSSKLTYLKKTYIYKKIKAMWTLHKLIILIKNRIFKFYNDFGNCLSFYFSFILFSLFLLPALRLLCSWSWNLCHALLRVSRPRNQIGYVFAIVLSIFSLSQCIF